MSGEPRCQGLFVLMLLLALTGCSAAGASGGTGGRTRPPSAPTAAGKAEPFSLYTHCGIDELTVDGRWYRREGGRLDDGNGNPPAGWDDPFQPGWLSASGSTVVFRDQAGHVETFRLRPGATAPTTVCC